MREFRPGSFQILPPIIKNLLIINALVFLAYHPFAPSESSTTIENLFALHTWQSPLFKPWQLITHLFLHGSWDHIFFNMFALWMFGSILENLWGPKRFLTFYFICGLGAALSHMVALYFGSEHLINDYTVLAQHFNVDNFANFYSKENLGNVYQGASNILQQWRAAPDNQLAAEQASHLAVQFVRDTLNEPTLGASGAVFGCLAAFGYLFPNTYIYLYFLFPIKAKWFVLFYAAYELFATVQNSAGDNVAHVAHLGGALFGFLLVYFWNKTNKRTFY
jgi:membrane associated rhomboid family serine protease